MAATFEIKINAIRTATVGSYTDVVKQVDWVMIGEEEAQKFELPQTTTLADPVDNFIPLSNLTEAEVIQWINDNEINMKNIKSHIQYVLTREINKKALTETNIPWASQTSVSETTTV